MNKKLLSNYPKSSTYTLHKYFFKFFTLPKFTVGSHAKTMYNMRFILLLSSEDRQAVYMKTLMKN